MKMHFDSYEVHLQTVLRGKLISQVYTLKLNCGFTAGVPDCYYSGSDRDLWSEHKRVVQLPKLLDLTRHTITTKLQQAWLKDRYYEGRNVSMVVFTEDQGHRLFMGLEWMKPISRDDFVREAVDMKQLAEQLISYLGPK